MKLKSTALAFALLVLFARSRTIITITTKGNRKGLPSQRALGLTRPRHAPMTKMEWR